VLKQIPQLQIEKLREQTELCRAQNWSAIAPLVIGESIQLEALYLRAVELAFDSIPLKQWRRA
jgi:hypothetical protein